MQKEKCSHLWEMTNVAAGLIVFKKCFHCARVSTCFTLDKKPPLEPLHEKNHFWNFMESDETFHFDLKCAKCDTLVKLDELVSLMMCTGCDETCQVDLLRRKLEPGSMRVYIVLGCRPVEERKQLSQEKFAAIEDYINQRCNHIKSGIKLVSHTMVKNIEKCYADVIKDADMLFAITAKGE